MRGEVRVLLVEDNPADSFIFEKALVESGLRHRLEVVRDGDDALRRIEAEPPDLIVLDLNLPKVDGWEVLDALDRSDALRAIPVCVLSSSRAPEDRERASRRPRTIYLAKPDGLDAYLAVGSAVRAHWESRTR